MAKNAWFVRAGEKGFLFDDFREKSVIGIGWNELGNISKVKSYEGLKTLFKKVYPSYSPNEVGAAAGQISKFMKSLEIALDLTKHTGRVIVITPSKAVSSTDADVVKKVKQSDIKIIYESELLEIRGDEEVEKVLVHDLNEDEEYELFVDAIIILAAKAEA